MPHWSVGVASLGLSIPARALCQQALTWPNPTAPPSCLPAEEGVVAMLSMEDEVPSSDASPTASSGASSEHTAFAPVASLTGSDASSRLEDAVFRCVAGRA